MQSAFSISLLYYSFCNNLLLYSNIRSIHSTQSAAVGTEGQTRAHPHPYTHLNPYHNVAGPDWACVSLIKQPRGPLPLLVAYVSISTRNPSRSVEEGRGGARRECGVHCTNDFQAFSVRLLQKVYDFVLNKKNIVYNSWKSKKFIKWIVMCGLRSTL